MQKTSRFLAPLLLCLIGSAVTFAQIYFFRPLFFQALPKTTWVPASLVGGLAFGLGVFFSLRILWQRISYKGIWMAALALFSAVAAVLPGPHRPILHPNAITGSGAPSNGAAFNGTALLIDDAVTFLSYLLLTGLLASLILYGISCPMAARARFAGRNRTRLARLILLGAFAGLVTLTNLTGYAFINNIESKDAGVFLYTAQQMLSGRVPYRDVWDHKPPMVFAFNALGLTLGNGSAWGVWALEVALLVCAGWLLYRILRRWDGEPAALAGLFLWITGLFLAFRADETNVPEAWGIFLQAALLAVIDRWAARKQGRWGLLLAGALTGLLFMLKQTQVGLGLAFALALLIQGLIRGSGKNTLRSLTGSAPLARSAPLAWFALGAVLAAAPVALYLAANGALGDFWDAAFYYSALYVRDQAGGGLAALLPTLANALLPAAAVAYLGWLAAAYRAIKGKWGQAPLSFRAALLAFPLEILLAALSGRNFTYYYLSWLYCIAIFGSYLAGMLFSALRGALDQQPIRPGAAGRPQTASIPTTLLYAAGTIYLCLLVAAFGSALSNSVAIGHSRNTHVLTVEYILAHTTPSDPVLVWGNEAAINFYTARRSPTRFVYQYPLFTPGYLDRQKAAAFYHELQDHPPKFIVDTADPLMPPFESAETGSLMEASMAYLHSHYHYQETVMRWKVYERNP